MSQYLASPWNICAKAHYSHVKLRDKPRFVWLVRASSAAPNFLNQRRKQAAGGVFLFGYFILDKQN